MNPLAGCLPTLATIPVFIGLYSSLTNAANEGMFDTEVSGVLWQQALFNAPGGSGLACKRWPGLDLRSGAVAG